MNTDLFKAIKRQFGKEFDKLNGDNVYICIDTNYISFEINVIDADGSSACSCNVRAELDFESKTNEIVPYMSTEDYIRFTTYYSVYDMCENLKPEDVDFDMLVDCTDDEFDDFTRGSSESDFDEDDIDAAKEEYSDRYNLDNYDKDCAKWIKKHTYKDIDISAFFSKLADVISDVTYEKDHNSSDDVEDFASLCYEINRFIAKHQGDQ